MANEVKPVKQKVIKTDGNGNFLVFHRTTTVNVGKDKKETTSVLEVQIGAGVQVNQNIYAAPGDQELTDEQKNDLATKGECVLVTYEN